MDPNTKLYMMLYGDKGESGRIYLLPDGSKFEPDKFYKVSVNIKDIGNVSRVLLIAHFEKSDSLGPSKLSSRLFMGLFVGTSRAATLNYVETCKLLCAFLQKYLRKLPWSGIL